MGAYENIRLNETTVKDGSGKSYASVLVPEGWSFELKVSRDIYRGLSYPFFFRIIMRSPDETCRIIYSSPKDVREDHLHHKNNGEVDNEGNLHEDAKQLEKLIAERAAEYSRMDGVSGMKLLKQIDYASNEARAKERKTKLMADFETDPLRVVNDHYYKGAVQQFSYDFRKHPRRLAVAMTCEETTYEDWKEVPSPIVSTLGDPSVKQVMLKTFPYAQFNKVVNKWIYTGDYYTCWHTWNQFDLDCVESDFEELFKNVFVPVINHGAVFTDELLEDLKTARAECAKKRYGKPVPGKTPQQESLERRAAQEAKTREVREKIRQTQQEIRELRAAKNEDQKTARPETKRVLSDADRGFYIPGK